jgi:hypothetical protein
MCVYNYLHSKKIHVNCTLKMGYVLQLVKTRPHAFDLLM